MSDTLGNPVGGVLAGVRATGSAVEVKSCPVCDSPDAHRLLELPKFPLTGIYVSDPSKSFAVYDNAWLVCSDCGHGYLERQIDPLFLYEDTYTHRSSVSGISRSGNDFLWAFIQRVTGCSFHTSETRLKSILEIGCNDFYLTARLRDVADEVVGVDPIWRKEQPHIRFPNVSVYGKSIEEIEPWRDLGKKPDLVVSSHTLEHIAQPFKQMEKIVGYASKDAVFVIEVPLQDAMVDHVRFDQVFHQHVQYFSFSSMARFVDRLGCEIRSWEVNHRYWGGTLLVAFQRKGEAGGFAGSLRGENWFPVKKMEKSRITKAISVFRDRCRSVLHDMLDFSSEGPVYAFGASQMLPSLIYHMPYGEYGIKIGSGPSWLKGIIDDNPDRIGKFYPGWADVPIIDPSGLVMSGGWRHSGVWVSALDSARDIVRRVIRFEPRILFPLAWRG